MEGSQLDPAEVVDRHNDVPSPWCVEPDGTLETTITELWMETFKLGQVGRDDNFFELGGDSLKGLELMDKLAGRIGVELPVVMLFQNPTPREMARYIVALEHNAGEDVELSKTDDCGLAKK